MITERMVAQKMFQGVSPHRLLSENGRIMANGISKPCNEFCPKSIQDSIVLRVDATISSDSWWHWMPDVQWMSQVNCAQRANDFWDCNITVGDETLEFVPRTPDCWHQFLNHLRFHDFLRSFEIIEEKQPLFANCGVYDWYFRAII
jgi:hypothetical protein